MYISKALVLRAFGFSVEKAYCYSGVSYFYCPRQSFVNKFFKTVRHFKTTMQ